METQQVREIFGNFKEFHGFNFELKPLQVKVLEKLLKKESVAVVLPTGYGKSLIYSIFCKILDQVTRTLTRYMHFLNNIYIFLMLFSYRSRQKQNT